MSSKYPRQPPMVDYTMKMMLLEAVRCRNTENITGLLWIQRQLFKMAEKYEQIRRRGPKKN